MQTFNIAGGQTSVLVDFPIKDATKQDGSALSGVAATNLIPAPTSAFTLDGTVATTGGQMTGNQTIYVGYTWVTAYGESTISPLLTVVIPAGTNTNNFTLNNPSPPVGATGFNVYAGTSNAAGSQYFNQYAGLTQNPFVYFNPYTLSTIPPTVNNAYTAILNGVYKRDIDSTATPFTPTTGTPGTWSSGGFSCPDTTNLPGVYELGIPNAALSPTGNPNNCYIALSGFQGMQLTELLINLTNNMQMRKNKAFNNFQFPMFNASGTGVITGAAVTAQVSQDGSGFGPTTNSVVEVGDGLYEINLSANDLNGNSISLLFTATNAKQQFFQIVTQT